MTNARELIGRRQDLPLGPSSRTGRPDFVDRPVPMAGESGLECRTCQAVTGFAHDFRDDAARAITVATAGTEQCSSQRQVTIERLSEPAPIPVWPEGELSGAPEGELG